MSKLRKLWAVTDCGELTTGSIAESPERPYLLFDRKVDAEARQAIILGKVQRRIVLTPEEFKKELEHFWLEGMHDGINDPMSDRFERRFEERYE